MLSGGLGQLKNIATVSDVQFSSDNCGNINSSEGTSADCASRSEFSDHEWSSPQPPPRRQNVVGAGHLKLAGLQGETLSDHGMPEEEDDAEGDNAGEEKENTDEDEEE